MKNTVYVGMYVHKESFTVGCYTFEEDKVQYQQKMLADYKLILKYIARMRKYYGDDAEFVCGYEAGCLGYIIIPMDSWHTKSVEKRNFTTPMTAKDRWHPSAISTGPVI